MYSDIVKQNIAIVYEDHLTNCDKKPLTNQIVLLPQKNHTIQTNKNKPHGLPTISRYRVS